MATTVHPCMGLFIVHTRTASALQELQGGMLQCMGGWVLQSAEQIA